MYYKFHFASQNKKRTPEGVLFLLVTRTRFARRKCFAGTHAGFATIHRKVAIGFADRPVQISRCFAEQKKNTRRCSFFIGDPDEICPAKMFRRHARGLCNHPPEGFNRLRRPPCSNLVICFAEQKKNTRRCPFFIGDPDEI